LPNPSSSIAPYKLYNIGNNNPVDLLYFIEVLEKTIGKKAKINFLPIQSGDVLETYADIKDLTKATEFKPQTSIEDGINKFVSWYKDYHG